jgi:cellobiose phosphorylase
MIAGPDSQDFGQAKNSWLTGTAAWNYVAITQWILGVRPAYDGLQITPVFPQNWNTFSVTRRFRGVDYHINVQRRGEGDQLVLVVDGIKLCGDVVPVPKPGTKQVRVSAVIGGATATAAR